MRRASSGSSTKRRRAPTARPFTYDFRRTLTSATVITVILITVVLSVAFVPFLRSAIPPPLIPSSNVAGVTYFDNSTGVNVLVYSFNQFGQPISGTQLNATAQSGTTTKAVIQSTNGSGYAHIIIDVPYPTGTSANTLSVTSGGIGAQESIPPQSGTPSPLFSDIGPVIDASNSSKVDAGVFYAGPNGAPPKGYAVYFSVNGGFGGNESSMTELGTMAGYFQVFSFPSGTNITATDSLFIALFDPAGTQILANGMSGSEFLIPSQVLQLSNVESIASSFVGGLLGLFVPLMAVLASYSTYGKDRVSGVLESVLARPVSRRGLSISRFTSTSLAMIVAVVLTMVALDLVVYFVAGFYLGWVFLGTTIAALSVEATAFVGIMFAMSRGIRSGGALVGLGVGLWAILELFWSIIILLVAYVFHISFGSVPYYALTLDSSFFNPAQFYSLVSTLSSSSSAGFQFTPSDYGITPLTLVATGVLWVVLPFALFLYLAVKRD